MAADDSTQTRRDVHAGPVRRTLVVMIDDAIVTHLLPETGELVIGRGQGVEIRVDHPSVSRAHVALELRDGMRIRDLGSANGTSLRGARLPASRSIEIGANETFLVGD
ncbi:MAG: FHA domain-containing protein, partial [Proteobacteria bacterium]|nr:FHA domain-containing protein [Pseudomonadota bacterium]